MCDLLLPAEAGEPFYAGGKIFRLFNVQRDPLFRQRRLQAVKMANDKCSLTRRHPVLAPLPWRGDK